MERPVIIEIHTRDAHYHQRDLIGRKILKASLEERENGYYSGSITLYGDPYPWKFLDVKLSYIPDKWIEK